MGIKNILKAVNYERVNMTVINSWLFRESSRIALKSKCLRTYNLSFTLKLT